MYVVCANIRQFRHFCPNIGAKQRSFSLSDRKISDVGLIINPSHMSTNPENLVKIGPVYSDITCLEVGPLKITKYKRNSSRIYSPPRRHAGRAG